MGFVMKNNLFFLITIISSFFILQNSALAVDCYEFQTIGSPVNEPLFNEEVQNKTWCFLSQDGQFIGFNFDDEEILPELMFISAINPDGNVTSLWHGVLSAGVRSTVEQTELYLNPYEVPVTPQTLNKIIATKKLSRKTMNTRNVEHKIEEALAHFHSLPQKSLNDFEYKINQREEKEEAKVTDDKLPANGYWWPHSGVPLARPSDAPLKKYDQYVKTVSGTDPKSVEWELANHSLEHVEWGGHCNGWAAASLLHGFYEKTLLDEANQNIITPSDIQGLRTETSFCVDWAFYGKRYLSGDGQTSDLNDIHADKFHKVLRYYIKHLNKPVIGDYVRSDSVDNHVITGYKFTMNEVVPKQIRVDAVVTWHEYSESRVNSKSVARPYLRNYTYDLFLDNAGNIVSGTWVSQNNPDFLWVPLAQKKCGRENPRMHHNYIEKMIQTLPKVTTVSLLSKITNQWEEKKLEKEEEFVLMDGGGEIIYGFNWWMYTNSNHNNKIKITAQFKDSQGQVITEDLIDNYGWKKRGTKLIFDRVIIKNITNKKLAKLADFLTVSEPQAIKQD
jgi:hypothetical protein